MHMAAVGTWVLAHSAALVNLFRARSIEIGRLARVCFCCQIDTWHTQISINDYVVDDIV